MVPNINKSGYFSYGLNISFNTLGTKSKEKPLKRCIVPQRLSAQPLTTRFNPLPIWQSSRRSSSLTSILQKQGYNVCNPFFRRQHSPLAWIGFLDLVEILILQVFPLHLYRAKMTDSLYYKSRERFTLHMNLLRRRFFYDKTERHRT